jgi:guanosine-3',5'-bis(diphosphate) 3'-pyrophosphohydrolase
MEKVVKHFGFKKRDDLIANVGFGKITPLQIIRKVVPKPESEEEHESLFNKLISPVRKKKQETGVIVQGIDDILLKFGKCCQPVPGDLITGYITQGYGVTVHRTSCVNALKMNPERQVDVEWDKNITEVYPVKIRINSYDRVGLLADVAATISKNGSNILSAHTETKENKTVDTFFTITVKATEHLNSILSAIKKVKHVYQANRVC